MNEVISVYQQICVQSGTHILNSIVHMTICVGKLLKDLFNIAYLWNKQSLKFVFQFPLFNPNMVMLAY